MSLSSQAHDQNDKIVIQMSPWGDFFVWIAHHVEQLRRKHRIIGHLSADPNVAHSICLPLILSIEETALLLYREIAELQSTQPVRDLNPPSPRALYKFDLTLSQHYNESAEVFKLQKRQKAQCYYSEILRGQKKRKERQAARSGELTPTANESASKKRSEKKQRRCKRRKTAASNVESTVDYLDDDYLSTEGAGDSIPQSPLPTLDELLSTSGSHEEEEVKMVKFIPIHRPRPTPREWIRDGEHSTLSIPLESRRSIEEVARWLLDVSSKSRPESDEATIVRCKVFEDLWSKGFHVTCSASKMGGDFLVYQGDPLFYHASHIVISSPPQAAIHLSRLTASLRIANSVRKALVIATLKSNEESQDGLTVVNYVSLYWMGSRIPPPKCTESLMK